MQLLRINHDPEWELLPVHELWEHERVQLGLRREGRARPSKAELRRRRTVSHESSSRSFHSPIFP